LTIKNRNQSTSFIQLTSKYVRTEYASTT